MKNFKLACLPMILVGVTSCIDAAPRETTQSTPSGIPPYQRVVNGWIGDTATEMIKQWGPPDQSLRIAGKEYIVYEKWTSEGYQSPSYSRYYYGYNRPSTSFSSRTLECTFTFEIRQGIIVGGNVTGANKHSKWCADGS